MRTSGAGSGATLVMIVAFLLYAALSIVGQLLPRAEAHAVYLKLNTVTGWIYTPAEPFSVQVISTADASRDDVLAPVLQIYPQFHVTDIVRQDVVGPAFMLPDVP